MCRPNFATFPSSRQALQEFFKLLISNGEYSWHFASGKLSEMVLHLSYLIKESQRIQRSGHGTQLVFDFCGYRVRLQ